MAEETEKLGNLLKVAKQAHRGGGNETQAGTLLSPDPCPHPRPVMCLQKGQSGGPGPREPAERRGKVEERVLNQTRGLKSFQNKIYK